MKCLLNVTSVGKLFIKIHCVVYSYVRLCLMPYRLGYRLPHFVAQNGKFYMSQLWSTLKGDHMLILGISLPSPIPAPHYCLFLLQGLHCSGPALSADTISPGSVLYLLSDLGVLL